MFILDAALLPAPFNSLPLPVIGASPDGVIGVDGNLVAVAEVKCRFPFVDDGESGYTFIHRKKFGKVLPAYIFAQCQIQMLCTGLSKCVLVEWSVTMARAYIIDLEWPWCSTALSALSVCYRYATTHHTLPPFDEWLQDQHHPVTQLLDMTLASCKRCGTMMADKDNVIALRHTESMGADGNAWMPL
jgi:hypothetical protein